jgi:S-methylmethionine-dependent homocysteine/selenocysteine methylase
MAISDEQYGLMRKAVFREAKGDLRALASLPNKTELRAAFDVVNDLWEDNKASTKSGIDTALGLTTTAPLAKAIGKAWLTGKFDTGG